MSDCTDRSRFFLFVMEQSNGAGVGNAPQAESGENSQTGAATMTYANLETLTRLNTEDLTSILSTGQRDEGHHYGDSQAGDEPTGFIVAMTSAGDSQSGETYQAGYVVTQAADGDSASVGGAADERDGAAGDADMDPQLAVHTYCKPSMRHVQAETGGGDEGESGEHRANSGLGALSDGVTARTDLIDLKTVLPSPTTRRVLLIDDGNGDLEMAKTDVEFLLRGDAAGIVLREGKRSEVWSRFGKVTFQGRKVKGYVACIYCRQVYAFGDAHSTGTSTLKKHRCPAQSLVTTASPLTPTLATNHSPASSSSQQQQQHADHVTGVSYVNFPSPSVVVSIATMRSSADLMTGAAGVDSLFAAAATQLPAPTRVISSGERDELVRSAGVLVGSAPTLAPAALLNLAKLLVELGARHGSGGAVLEDLGSVLKSPLLEATLPSLAAEFRAHFVEEARTCSAGIGIIVVIGGGVAGDLCPAAAADRHDDVVGVTIKMAYCVNVAGDGAPFVRQAPLRHACIRRHAADFGADVSELLKLTLRDDRLDHLRRAIVYNGADLLNNGDSCGGGGAPFSGELAAECALSSADQILADVCSSRRHRDWSALYDSIQQVANHAQIHPDCPPLQRSPAPLEPTRAGLAFIDLLVGVSCQWSELHKWWHDSRQDLSLWSRIDRQLVNQASLLLLSVQGVVAKVAHSRSEPTLYNVLLARCQIVALCTPRSSDAPALLAIKQTLADSVRRRWPVTPLHLLACVLHPAFKHMRRLDVSDEQRAHAYATLRNLLRHSSDSSSASAAPPNAPPAAPQLMLQPTDHILRNTLEGGGKNGDGRDVKRKRASDAPQVKRQRTTPAACSSSSVVALAAAAAAAPAAPAHELSFDFCDMADFNVHCAADSADELDLYLDEKVLQQDVVDFSNVLVYWKSRRNVFPALSNLAFSILALPPVALPSAAPDAQAGQHVTRADLVLQRQLLQLVAHASASPSGSID